MHSMPGMFWLTPGRFTAPRLPLPGLAGLVAVAGLAGPPPAQADADTVERGAWLVAVTGCNDCHTPFKPGPNGPEPDPSRLLSGHPESAALPPPPPLDPPWVWAGTDTNTAFAGPWGISYAANLTPDPETGIGGWTKEMFTTAIKTGLHLGAGRPIMPPMPWPAYAHLGDADLGAIFDYLKSLPPVRNRVPEYAPPAAGQ